MNFKRGEILFDPNFVYPDGGPPCDKYLLVVNFIHLYPADVIIIPCKTNIQNYPYKDGCNEKEQAFYFDRQIGIYKANTVIQLYHITTISASLLKDKIEKKEINRWKEAKKNELEMIFDCLKKIKEDIPQYIQDIIF